MRRLIAALWLGSGLFIAIAAAAVFRVSGPDAIGVILTRWHYIALIAPLALIFFEWRRQRGRIVLLLFIAIVIAAVESAADVRIATMRRESVQPVRMLRSFQILHGVSTLLLLADIAVAAAVVALDRD